MAQPVPSIVMHMPKSARSIAHNRENDRYFLLQSQWNDRKTADTHIISSDSNPCKESTMAQPVSSGLGDLVTSSHSDDFEGNKSNLSQYKQILGSKSYWQGYDVGI